MMKHKEHHLYLKTQHGFQNVINDVALFIRKKMGSGSSSSKGWDFWENYLVRGH